MMMIFTCRQISRVNVCTLARFFGFVLILERAHSFSPTTAYWSHRPSQLKNSIDESNNDEIGVGIDLGTTNSAIAILKDSRPSIVNIPNNGRTIQSVVAFDEDFNPLVGNDAIVWETSNRKSAYRNIKRVVGTGVNHISRETAKVVPHLVPTFKESKKRKKTTLLKQIQDATENPTMLYFLDEDKSKRKMVSPVEISSVILKKLIAVAAVQSQKKIGRAVIGVPAYFHDAQREATIQAAKDAGISKVKLLREPEAAALAYGVEQDSDEEELVLVFDLGGGTYDVSMLLVGRGLTEIICTAGDAQLGGSNFDAKVAQSLARMAQFTTSASTSDILVRAAEKVRIFLSNNRQVNLALPRTEEGWTELLDVSRIIVPINDDSFHAGTSNSTHVFATFTRKEMEVQCKEEFQALLRPIREVAIMAGALLPGDARPSIVETALEMEKAFTDAEHFYEDDREMEDETLKQIQAELDMKEAKKAQQKGRKKARQVTKEDRKFRNESRKVMETAQSDVKVRGDGIAGRPISRVVLVGGATRMPAIGRLLTALTGIVPQKTVDPDEAVALGCAVHVGVLDGASEMGTVLNPMQAAILRAVVEQQRGEQNYDDFLDDDEDFYVVEET